MASLNKVTLIGNVGKDPEIRSTHDGREVANLVLATSESWKDKDSGEKKEKTEWHRITCFNPGLVNVIRNYVKKGSKLYLEGQLQTRKWQDQSGNDRYTTEVVLQGYSCALIMLDSYSKNESQEDEPVQSNEPLPYNTKASNSADDLNDDIPF